MSLKKIQMNGNIISLDFFSEGFLYNTMLTSGLSDSQCHGESPDSSLRGHKNGLTGNMPA